MGDLPRRERGVADRLRQDGFPAFHTRVERSAEGIDVQDIAAAIKDDARLFTFSLAEDQAGKAGDLDLLCTNRTARAVARLRVLWGRLG